MRVILVFARFWARDKEEVEKGNCG